jgi:site-specific recombinase XerD
MFPLFPQQDIDGFARYWRRRRPGSSTALHYTSDVTIFFQWVQLAPAAITVHHIDQFIDWQRALGRAAATIQRRLVAVRMFYDYLAYAQDQALPNPVCPRRHYIAPGRRLPQAVSDTEIEQLFETMGSHLRDRTMFTLMLHAGLRVGEVAKLCVSDVQLAEGQLPALRLNGKGQRERVVYLSATAQHWLAHYLQARPAEGPDRVFLNRRGQPLTITGIQSRLAHYCEQARIWVTCHQLRHTFASRMIAADIAVTSVQKLLGHVSIRTTQLYVHVTDKQVAHDYQKAVSKIVRGSLPSAEVLS